MRNKDEEEKKLFGNKKGNIDGRYDSFIASLLFQKENTFVFPANIKTQT
jgi:hypothetical protein